MSSPTIPMHRDPAADIAPKRIASAGWVACGLLAASLAGFMIAVLKSGWPFIGFDFRFFLPRLIDVRLHQLQDGWWQVQWWSPSFGAGLPAFADPQHTQFMLAQSLVPWLGPWDAAVAQAAVWLSVGVLLVFYACHRRLGCTATGSLLAAAVFGTSGFFWGHALTGHMGFNVFPLVALLPVALHGATPPLRAVSLLGLAGAVIVYGGGYTVILVFGLSALLLASLLPLWRPADYPPGGIWTRLALGAAFCLALTAAKLVACGYYLAQFPRPMDYQYSGPGWLAPIALISQTLLAGTVAIVSRWLPVSVAQFQAMLGGGEDVGYGPFAAILLLVAALLTWKRGSFRRRGPIWLWLALAASVWLAAEASLGRGLLWPLLKPLPLLRTLHENHRLAAAFALPLSLLIAPAWDFVIGGIPPALRLPAFGVALGMTFTSLEPYVRDRGTFWWSDFDASTIERTWHYMRTHPDERFPIRQVADVRADRVFLDHASNWKPYEPIFGYGYGGPDFRVRIQPGPVEPLPAAGGAWRFHHPLSFLSPRLAGIRPFDPIPGNEAKQLHSFLNRHQPDWPLPPWQHAANWLSLTSMAGMVVLVLLPASRRARSASLV